MNLSAVFSTVMGIRRIVTLVTAVTVGGAGYKYGPAVYHRHEFDHQPKGILATQPARGGFTTNTTGIRINNQVLGELSLTNGHLTSVTLGRGRECLLTPVMLDRHAVQLTVALKTRNANGSLHELAIAQVIAHTGKSSDVVVGDFSFSLTPDVISQ
jgi:hypothetical protein